MQAGSENNLTAPSIRKGQTKQRLSALAENAKVHDVISPTDCEWAAFKSYEHNSTVI